MPTLEEARPQSTPSREDGEFVDFGWRPIFKEHVNREGVPFGRSAMERIAQRCNDRIDESQDFCPVVVRHTKDDGSIDPEVIGFYGPYRAQRLPGRNGQPGKWAVYARERIYKEDAHKRKKYPRVSVEYWADKNDPTGGYFDPAALLGAETPELDLGIHYSVDPSDPTRTLMRYQRVVHYEAAAVAPGGSNTYQPSNDDEKPQHYQGGTLSQGDIQQIVAALRPVIQEAVTSEVAKQSPVGADPEHVLTDEEPAGELEGETPGIDDGSELEESEEPGQFADDDEDFENEDGAPGDEDDDSDLEEPGDDDTDILGSKEKKAAYAKQITADGHTLSTNQEPTMAAETPEQTVARYQKENTDYKKQVTDLKAENGELKSKYQKAVDGQQAAETKVTELSARVGEIESRERKATRYSKLRGKLDSGYVFDLDEEYEDTKSFDDAQFDNHVEKRITKYQRVPPTLGATGLRTADPKRPDGAAKLELKRERYSKLAAAQVQKARHEGQKGEAIEFKSVLNKLMTEDPEKIGA